MTKFWLVLASVLALCVSLMSQEKVPEKSGCMPYAGVPETGAWIDSTLVATNRPHRVSASREKELRDAYTKIEIAMSRPAVEKIMGKPDFQQVMIQSSAGKPTGVCINQWGYVFRKGDTNPISLQETAIYLSFSANGQLYWAVPQNLDLKQKGSPVQK